MDRNIITQADVERLGCGYCGSNMRMMCVCRTDCGQRGSHLCQHAPLAEARAWFEARPTLYSPDEVDRIMAARGEQR